jgi:GrpB-like predicted nucleotidyltransferase (UPF0157 family)
LLTRRGFRRVGMAEAQAEEIAIRTLCAYGWNHFWVEPLLLQASLFKPLGDLAAECSAASSTLSLGSRTSQSQSKSSGVFPKHTIAGSGMSDSIIVVEYDPKWLEIFESLRARIAGALGNLAAAIEHAGSTAVPGLVAKPVIDIDVALSSAHGLREAVARLAPLGYTHRGDLGIAGREAFSQPLGQPAHHLYICAPDCSEYRRHIAFRDYLRAHPIARGSTLISSEAWPNGMAIGRDMAPARMSL